MTHKNFSIALAAAVMSVVPAFANSTANHSSKLDEIASHARRTQTEAKQIADLWRAKRPDVTAINEKMMALETHAGELRREVGSLESSQPELSPGQRTELARIKQLSELIHVFVENKKNMLAGSDAVRNRGILRAKAEGIASRAELLQSAADRIRR